MKAIIMAGGFGTRIQPLSSSLPKPMLPVVNLPMMEHVINTVKKTGITEFIILLYFKPDTIKNYFGNGEDFGIKITYILPEDDFGTAGAVKKAAEYMDKTSLIISGDLITDFNINELLDFHKDKHSQVTICLTSVEDPLQFGVVITDKNDKILRFLEKPGWGEVFSDTINTGIYVIEKEIFDLIPENKPFDFSKDLFPLIMSKNVPIYGYNAEGYWRDVGNPFSYREAIMDVLQGKVDITIPGNVKKSERLTLYYQDDSFRSEKVIKGTVVTGKNVKVGGNAHIANSCIGSNVSVGNNTKIQNSIIWNNVHIGNNCILNNCVICNDVAIGNNVNMKNGGIVAENTEIGDFVVFEKDIIVWPGKQIEEDSILSSNLIWGDKWKKSIFEGGKVSGLTNVELSPELVTKLGAATGSIIPKNSYLVVSRDYHSASRMLKRSFLGGLLSTGTNVFDLRMSALPPAKLQMKTKDAAMGIHFRQSGTHDTFTEILFMQNTGISIDSATEKNIEKVYFRENFRRAHHEEIGKIVELTNSQDEYLSNLHANINAEFFKSKKLKIVVDLFNGTTTGIFPIILNELDVNSIILNAYHDQKKLARSYKNISKSINEIKEIVMALEADMGIIIFQNGEKFTLISASGQPLTPVETVLFTLRLIDFKEERNIKVYLPTAIPDILDNELSKVEIHRGKTTGINANIIKSYDIFVDSEFNIVFGNYSLCSDAMYNVLKIMEMLAATNKTVDEILNLIPKFSFTHNVVNCPSSKKGVIMRKMADYANNYKADYSDGIKIFYKDKGSVLMIPDQYSTDIHLYIESADDETNRKLLEDIKVRIDEWIR